MQTYKNYEITYNPAPIPVRGMDYQFAHKDFDGAPDAGDNRCGSGASIEDCMEQIDDIEDDV